MSLITWRTLDTEGEPTGPTNYIRFDAVTIEEFSRSANVTNYPIETGATLSDHYQPLPREVSIVGVVSDTPVKVYPPEEGMVEKATLPTVSGYRKPMQSAAAERRQQGLQVIRPVVGLPSRRLVRGNIERGRLEVPFTAPVLWFVEPVTRIRDVFLVLDELMDKRVPVGLVLLGGVEFTDMMITSHRAPRVAGAGGEVRFSLDLQQVIKADPSSVTAGTPLRAEPENKPRRDKGATGTKPAKGKDKAAIDKHLAQKIEALSRSLSAR